MDHPFKNCILRLCLVIFTVYDCNAQHGGRMGREPPLQPHEGYSYPEYKPFFPFPPPPPPNIPFTLERFLKHREYEMKFGDKLRKYAVYYNSPGYTPPPKNMPNPNIEYEVEYPYNPHVYLTPAPKAPTPDVTPQLQQPKPTPNTHRTHHHSHQLQNGPNLQNLQFNQPPIPYQPLVNPQQFPLPNVDPPILHKHQSRQSHIQPPQNGRHWPHQHPSPVQPQTYQQIQPQMHQHNQPYMYQPQLNMHQPQPNMHPPHPNNYHPQPIMYQQPNPHHQQSNQHQPQSNRYHQQPNNHHQWNQHKGISKPTFHQSPFSPNQHKPNTPKSLSKLMSSQQNQFNQYQQMVGGPEIQPAMQIDSQQNVNHRQNSQIQPNFQNVQPIQHLQTTNMPISLPGVQDLKSVAHRHHPPPSHSLPLPSRHHSMQPIDPQPSKQEQHPIKHMLASPAAKVPLEPPSQQSGIPGSIREYIQKPRSNTKGLLLALQKYLMQLTKVQNSKKTPTVPVAPSAPVARVSPAAPRHSDTNEPSFKAPLKRTSTHFEPQLLLPKAQAQAPVINPKDSVFQIPLQSQIFPATTSLVPSSSIPFSEKVTHSLSFDANTQPTMIPKTITFKEPSIGLVTDSTANVVVTRTP